MEWLPSLRVLLCSFLVLLPLVPAPMSLDQNCKPTPVGSFEKDGAEAASIATNGSAQCQIAQRLNRTNPPCVVALRPRKSLIHLLLGAAGPRGMNAAGTESPGAWPSPPMVQCHHSSQSFLSSTIALDNSSSSAPLRTGLQSF